MTVKKKRQSLTGRSRKERMVPLPSAQARKPLRERPTVIGDLRNMQEMLGLDTRDLYYVTASVTREMPLAPEYSSMRLDSISRRAQLSLLVRFLSACREGNFLPQSPSLEDVQPILMRVLREEMPTLGEKDITWAKMGMLAGTTDWSGRWWSGAGTERSALVNNIFLALVHASHKIGIDKVAKIYHGVLTDEAHARGFEDGLKGVIRNRSWHR
ncbi:MAG: hypothetical protein M0Z68_00385 [Gammaproteobacteria bacterium]|jgi:hypothetical protein|nr:hypothetical protein [Gammaproteobacteria bacterium]